MEVTEILNAEIDLEKLDKVIYEYIPSGFETRKTEHKYVDNIDFDSLKCKKYVNLDRAKLSIGTLGGGNHFIEVNKDNSGTTYLVIHSGSRNLGKQVAEYYQELGYNELANVLDLIKETVLRLKKEGRQKEIESEIKKIKPPTFNKHLAYVEGENFRNYLHDMEIVQNFAVQNRKAMMHEILKQMNLMSSNQFTTIHNYIDMKTKILRKGSVSAQEGERLIIPINMRDGSLICIGKGNPDWNYSAPHGAGRLMSRSKAKELVTMDEYEKSMKGIYTTSVNQSTIDESPMAYKPMQEIIDNIQDTVEILKVIKPIYNFKAGE
jgi:RNA-splicing ligase RtcB